MDQRSEQSEKLKTNLKFRDRIWVTTAILAKRSLLFCKGLTFELILHVLILFIGSKKYAVLRSLNSLLINTFIVFFPTASPDIMSDVTLSVAMTPADIESKGNGFSGSRKVVSKIDNICWAVSSTLLIRDRLRSGCLYFCGW